MALTRFRDQSFRLRVNSIRENIAVPALPKGATAEIEVIAAASVTLPGGVKTVSDTSG